MFNVMSRCSSSAFLTFLVTSKKLYDNLLQEYIYIWDTDLWQWIQLLIPEPKWKNSVSFNQNSKILNCLLRKPANINI